MTDESNVVSFERKKPKSNIEEYQLMLAGLLRAYNEGRLSESGLIGNLSIELEKNSAAGNELSKLLSDAPVDKLAKLFTQMAECSYKCSLIYSCYASIYAPYSNTNHS
jgi:hypothetical protein